MFADYVKMAAKALALATGVVIVINFVTSVSITVPPATFIADYINKVYTIGCHYIPFFATLWTLGTTLLLLNVSFYTARIGLIAVRWILKVNE